MTTEALEVFGVDASFLAVQFLSMALACSLTLALASLLQRRRDRERQHIERQLTLNERIRDLNLRVVAEAIPQMVWRKRADGTVDYFNSAWYAYTGLTPEESLEYGFYDAIHPDDAARAKEAWVKASATGSLYEVEYLLRRHDGVYRWFLARAAPLRNVDGEVFSWFGTCTDIDDQRRAREAVQKFAERAARVSDAFQVASLPESLPKVAGVRFDAVYEAGVAEALVGGDWYDAMRLLDGRILVSVGDVSGSGLAAAVTMNAMRQVIRGAAQNHADPPAILDAADRTLRMERPDGMVTAFVGILDPLTLTLNYACAGHPPPLLRHADGRLEELRGLGLPLGLWEKGFVEAPIAALEPGSLLVIYTDGLTESTRDLAEGEKRLFAAVAGLNLEEHSSCAGAIRDKVLVGGARDDVAILTVSIDKKAVAADSSVLRWTIDSSEPSSVMSARDDLVRALRARSTPERSVCDAELIFAELIGNVVRHAPGKTEVVLDAGGRLPVLNIIDEGPGFSRAAHLPADMMREGGRGLFIVSTLAKELNVTKRVGKGSHVRAVLEVGLLD
jgi:PAS domain S-box-containing protein